MLLAGVANAPVGAAVLQGARLRGRRMGRRLFALAGERGRSLLSPLKEQSRRLAGVIAPLQRLARGIVTGLGADTSVTAFARRIEPVRKSGRP
jgi:hypothetical protein